jgi:aryl-alcohol dehydrogenase (NADP+)
MQQVRLGRTGLKVSRICLGTLTFGLQSDEDTSRAILGRAADAGVTFLDTADAYPALLGRAEDSSRYIGRSEEIIGGWLTGRREEFVVATKAWAPTGPSPNDRGSSRRHLLAAVEASLRRLRTDWIDLYQLHAPDPDTPIEETLAALDGLVRAGKVRYIGCCNFLAYQFARALGRSEALLLTRFHSVQPRYNLVFREIERELLPLCAEEGVGVIPYNPVAGGLLTGKHPRDSAPAPNTRFTLGQAGDIYLNRYWHEREFDAIEEIAKLADQAGLPLATLAVAWFLANPVVTAPIVGASKPEQLDVTLAAADVTLDSDLLSRLDELTRPFRLGDTIW